MILGGYFTLPCAELSQWQGTAQQRISLCILEPKANFGKLCRGGCPQQLAGWDFKLGFFRAEQGFQISSIRLAAPNHFLTDVSTAFMAVMVIYTSWCSVPCPSPFMDGYLHKAAWRRGFADSRTFSQLAGDFGGCHSQCVGETLLPVTFPCQPGIILNGCQVFKSTWEVTFQRPGSLLGSSALVLSLSSEHPRSDCQNCNVLWKLKYSLAK